MACIGKRFLLAMVTGLTAAILGCATAAPPASRGGGYDAFGITSPPAEAAPRASAPRALPPGYSTTMPGARALPPLGPDDRLELVPGLALITKMDMVFHDPRLAEHGSTTWTRTVLTRADATGWQLAESMVTQPRSGAANHTTESSRWLPAQALLGGVPDDAALIEVPAGTFRCARTTSQSGDTHSEAWQAVGIPVGVRLTTRSPQLTITMELLRIEDSGAVSADGPTERAATASPGPRAEPVQPGPPAPGAPGPGAPRPAAGAPAGPRAPQCDYCGQAAEPGAAACSQCGAELR